MFQFFIVLVETIMTSSFASGKVYEAAIMSVKSILLHLSIWSFLVDNLSSVGFTFQ